MIMKLIKKLRSNLGFNIASAIIVLLVISSIIISSIGYISFKNAFKREYSKSTYNIARTAATLIKADDIDNYLTENKNEETYNQTKEYLDKFCEKMNVTLIYVIKVNTEDYKSFKSIFNSVLKDSDYKEWELGYERETTNKEYEKIYKDIYENNLEYGTVYRTKKLNGAEEHITTLVPIKNSEDKVVSILCVQRPILEIKKARRPYLINIIVATIILSILVIISTTKYLKRQFVNPVRKIIKEANRFAQENKISKKLGKVSKIEEISLLSKTIDKMEADMMNYIENVTKLTKDKERISSELNVASAIQENSIPNIFPPFPDRKEFDIYASMTPAKEVGGDFYDFFLIDDDHLALVMADVSGKGIPAALFMMVTKILISDRTLMGGTPSEILKFVNERICEHNKVNMFVTLWLGILELSTGKLVAANAGHEKPIICKQNENFELIKDERSIVLGAFEKTNYKDYEIKLNPKDKIFLYTDGIPEATNKDNQMFGIENMIQTLNYYKDRTPEKIIDGMKKSIHKFVGNNEQFDDLTMMCVELKRKNNLLIIDAKNENLDEVNEFINPHIKHLDEKTQNQIELCVEEIFVNIASYAYKDTIGKVEITIDSDSKNLSMTFKDNGKKFNPLIIDEPDKKSPASKRKVGGLGIFLVKKYMDDVNYEYENEQNILTITKKIK